MRSPLSLKRCAKCETLQISEAQKNDLTGQLKWEFKVEPNESKKIDLRFNVKYPKNKPISVGKSNYKYRKVRTKF